MTRASTTLARVALVVWTVGSSAAALTPDTSRLVQEATSGVASIGHGALAVDQGVRLALAIAIAFSPLPPLLVASFRPLHPLLAGIIGISVASAAGALATNNRTDLVAVTTAALLGVAVGTLGAWAIRANADAQRAPQWARFSAMVALTVFLVATGLVGFWHAPVDLTARPALGAALGTLRHAGAPSWLGYDVVEFGANIVFFIPLGLFLSLLLPPRRRWLTVAVGFVLSSCIEVGQGLLLPSRSASLDDLAANTAGTVVGVLTGIAVSGWLTRLAARERRPE